MVTVPVDGAGVYLKGSAVEGVPASGGADEYWWNFALEHLPAYF